MYIDLMLMLFNTETNSRPFTFNSNKIQLNFSLGSMTEERKLSYQSDSFEGPFKSRVILATCLFFSLSVYRDGI